MMIYIIVEYYYLVENGLEMKTSKKEEELNL